MTANSIEYVCRNQKRSNFYPKLVGSSIANVTLSVAKDHVFTQMFGLGPPRALPLISYGLFAGRDTLTILAGFNMPPIIAAELMKQFGWTKHAAENIAQVTVPCAMQFVSTPLHLLGIDMYNKNGQSFSERVAFIGRNYIGTSMARIARILPAYGVGGIVNKKLRRALIHEID